MDKFKCKEETEEKHGDYNDFECDYEESSDEVLSEGNGEGRGVNVDKEEDRCYRKITELSKEDILALEFDSENDACQFYCNYARAHGFVIRKFNVKRDRSKEIVQRQFVCNKQGLRLNRHSHRLNRVRDHRPLTRTGCKANLRVYLDYETSKWKVSSFWETHNHELTPSKFSHLVRGYRGMSEADKAQVDTLHNRWTQYAKCDFIASVESNERDCGDMSIFRFGALMSASNFLCNLASKDINDFVEVKDEILKLTHKLQKKCDKRQKEPSSSNVIGDPSYVKTKGAPKKRTYGKKRCSNCKKTGHTIQTCNQGHGGERTKDESETDVVLDSETNVSEDFEGVKINVDVDDEKERATQFQGKYQKPGSVKGWKSEEIPPSKKSCKKHKSERRELEVQVTSIDGCNGPLSRVGSMPASQGANCYPQYQVLPAYQFPQFTRYSTYGGFPMYPHIIPYFPGSNTRPPWNGFGGNFDKKNG